jgi:Uma2 family endonuclease
MAVTTPPLMTAEQLLALPNDKMERWLIRGELREQPMTVRNFVHSGIMACVTYALEAWRRQQAEPRGKVLCGEAGCRLQRDPETVVGIDVVYVSAEVAARRPDDTSLIDGVPVLVVEILSPNDTLENTEEKIDSYLEAGVPLVWIINPYRRTVTVHQPGEKPVLFNSSQELSGEPHLPGFRVPVADLFA